MTDLIPYPIAYKHLSTNIGMEVPVTKKSAASKPEAARSLKPGGSRPFG